MQFALEDIFLFMMVLARVTGLFLYLPVLSSENIPGAAKIALGGAFAVMLYPMIEFGAAFPQSGWEVAFWMAKELVVGLTMGFAARMIFFVLDFASYVLTTEIGLMPSPEFDPSSARSFNPLGSIVYFLGLMILLNGSEYDILRAFVSSYQVAPMGFTGLNPEGVEFMVQMTAGVFKVGILMAAPVIAVNFLVNLIFAVLGKVVPKLNVFILSFSARILIGTSVLAFSTMLIVGYASNYIDRMPEDMLRMVFLRPLF